MNINPFKKKKAQEMPPMEGPPLPGPPVPEGVPPPSSTGPPAPGQGGRIIPTDEVRALSSRGVSEPDIIRTLRREGYSTNEIDQAMKEALRSRVSGDYKPMNEFGEARLGGPPDTMPRNEEIPQNLAYPTAGADEGEAPPPAFEPPPASPQLPEEPTGSDFLRPAISERPPPQQRRAAKGGVDRREIEELAEVIVEEKLREMRNKIKTFDASFSQINTKMENLYGEINKMRSEKSGEVKGIEEKIESYSTHIDGLNSKIESMERALKDSLSPMLDSMRSLSELVKTMKQKKE